MRPDRPRHPAAALEPHQAIPKGLLHRLLRDRIERGAHPQAARIDAVLPGIGIVAVTGDELAPHLLHIIAFECALGLAPRIGAFDRAERGGIGHLLLGGG